MRNYPLYILIALALCVILIFVLIWPRYKALSSLKVQISSRDAELRSQDEHLQNLESILSRIEENKEDFSKIESALPKKTNPVSLLNLIQGTASNSGLVVTDLSTKSGTHDEDKGIEYFSVELSLRGNYSSVKNFLSTIERSARMIKIDALHLSAGGEAASDTFEITLKAYYYQ